MPLIEEHVSQARAGRNEKVVCQMPSGWVVMGDVQFLEGYCLLLPDPVVPSLNDLSPRAREQYLTDMVLVGDAVLKVTGARRINYEILGNLEPELHAHIFPRFATEPEDLRLRPVWFYDWNAGPAFSPARHGDLMQRIEAAITSLRPEQ